MFVELGSSQGVEETFSNPHRLRHTSHARKSQRRQSVDYLDAEALHDSVSQYKNDALTHTLLTEEDEFTFGKQLTEGQEARAVVAEHPERFEKLRGVIETGLAAEQALITHNLQLVFSRAERHQGKGVPLSDLVQEGNIGLMRGVKKYNYKLGRVSTYVTWWIDQAITRCILADARTIRLPVNVIEAMNRVMALQFEHEKNFGVALDDESLAQLTNFSVKDVKQLQKQYHTQHCLELDAPMEGKDHAADEDSVTFGEETADPDTTEDLAIAMMTKETLQASIEKLPEFDRQVIQLLFNMGNPEVDGSLITDSLLVPQIAELLHVSIDKVRNARSRALFKIQRALPKE